MGKRKRRTTVNKIAALLDQIADDLRQNPPHKNRWRAKTNRLELYWKVGELLDKYVGGEEERTVSELAKTLQKHQVWLSAYHRFHRYFTPHEMREAMRQRLTFRHIMALLLLKGDDKKLRKSLQKEAAYRKAPSKGKSKGRRPLSGLELYKEVRAVVRAKGSKAARPKLKDQAIRIDRRHLHAAATRCWSFADWIGDLKVTLEKTPAISGTDTKNAARTLAGGIANDLDELAQHIKHGLGPRAKYLQPA